MKDDVYLRCLVCGWCHVAVEPGEPANTRCFRCRENKFTAVTADDVPHGVTLQTLTWPLPDQAPDETNDFGRYAPEHVPSREDELYAIILALVQQDCSTKDHNILDSWATSAYERAIEALDVEGFVEIDPTGGRIFAALLPKAHKFVEWMEIHDRRKRILEAREKLATVPGLTMQGLARLYNITEAELMASDP